MRVLPISSVLGFAAKALLFIVENIRTLLIAFLIPELLRRTYHWLLAYLKAWQQVPAILPGWIDGIVSECLSAIVIVAIVRFIALGETPRMDPRGLSIKAVLLVAAILCFIWLPLDYPIDRHDLFLHYLRQNLASGLPDKAADHQVWVLLGIVNLLVAIIAVAFFYPLIGIASVDERLDHKRWRGILTGNIISLLLLTAVSIAAISMARDLYWSVAHFLLPGLARYAPASVYDFDWRLETIYRLLFIPIDFLYDVLSGVMIGLLMKGLAPKRAATT